MGGDQVLSSGLADRADSEIIECADLVSRLQEAFQEVGHAVNTGENDPVVTEEVIDRFVEALVTLGLHYFDRRTDHYTRAVTLELSDEVCSLSAGACDDDRASGEWLICYWFFCRQDCVGVKSGGKLALPY